MTRRLRTILGYQQFTTSSSHIGRAFSSSATSSGILAHHQRIAKQHVSPLRGPFHPPPTPLALSKALVHHASAPLSHSPPHLHSQSALEQGMASQEEPTIHSEYESKTGTWQYIVADPCTRHAVIIDSVLDYNPCTHTLSTTAADALLALISQHSYTITAILETHIHADHVTAAAYLQAQLSKRQATSPPICIGKRIAQLQDLFARKYGVQEAEYRNAYDKTWDDDDVFPIGNMAAQVVHLPGHTPDHIGYRIGDNVFCGDSIFHPDIGTARCDFPGGAANALYASAQKLLRLPAHVRIWTGHDYASMERPEVVPWMTVGEHRARNRHVGQSVSLAEFVQKREDKDRELEPPKLLHESLQLNIRAGRLPRLEPTGASMLHLPLKAEGKVW
ncbi:hypothetical protein ACEQ8H_007213 [Pleosporales sp. CAS-2024a]